MKKLTLIITVFVMVTYNTYASETAGDLIKLTTHGVVLSDMEVVDPTRGYYGYCSILIGIQGHMYAVEGTTIRKFKRMGIKKGDTVLVCFGLNLNDRIEQIYIIEKLY